MRAAEVHDLNALKSRPETDPDAMAKLQGLLATAVERRIEQRIDELIDHEDDVLI